MKIRTPFRVLFIRLPYSFWDVQRDPNLENYPYRKGEPTGELSMSRTPAEVVDFVADLFGRFLPTIGA